MGRGILWAASAYILWGVLPLYWKALQGVPAFEILAHRMVWSLVVVAGLISMQQRWDAMRSAFRDPTTLRIGLASAAFITLNWALYIWAVNAGHVVETSLGYFITPLVNVLLGRLFLGERLRPWQAAAVTVALAGVAYLTLSYGSLPWIALILAFSFALYGLLRKLSPLDSVMGLAMETLVVALPALGYLVFLEWNGQGALGHTDAITTALLCFSGVVTAIPLLLFAAGARRITLTTLGILQYIAPTLQFLLGVFLYGEPLTTARLIGFALIWTALLLYTLDSFLQGRRAMVAQRPAS